MKQTALSIIVLVFSLSALFGQTQNEPITTKKVFGGYQFYQNNERVSLSKLTKIIQTNEEAYKEIKTAQTTNILATIIGGTGAFMLGWQLGGALAGGEFNGTMAGIGAGLVVVSIPISLKFNRQAKSAINTYNEGLKTGSNLIKPKLNFSCTNNGVGLSLNF